ncbi:MAG TPA: bifunctional [glutamate--ammonia ligase]-adenylyl-L-tyrosine phosphorylase/[glutamate--ammonia-ligase] adenylyltransferase [Polyangiaceae bacterium]|jgi:glutamate-ammonia-ligase adenylyltransferase
MPNPFRSLGDSIARGEAAEARRRFLEVAAGRGLAAGEDAADLAALLVSAYPALARQIDARPEDVLAVARGTKQARDLRSYRRVASALIGDLSDESAVRQGLRVFAQRERMRVAARELLPHTGSDVDVTSRELSDLADVCIELALTEALSWADRRFGVPRNAEGERAGFVVLGMGKLGGRELNAGSDVDLLLFYETDDGTVVPEGGAASDQTLHEYFTRVSQRLTATLSDVTEDGFVWRVDLRLRPEGGRGPLVNSLAAAERYYETWGRTWERAALLRARPVAGDGRLGQEVLSALAPFVWRREVNPAIADEMIALTVRARAEAANDPARDLKLGVGGIREVEFFAQSLQLIWGGREASVRVSNTLDALRKLRARGFVTDREGREMADAYLALRRLEHRVQFATGWQTHVLASPGDPLLERIARSMGFAGERELERDLEKTRRRVAARFASLSREGRSQPRGPGAIDRLLYAIDAGDESAVQAWLATDFGVAPQPPASPDRPPPSVANVQAVAAAGAPSDLARHLLALARRPDYPLGATTRDKYPDLAPVILEALSDAADPEQAARLMATFFARLGTPSVYARALAEDPRAARALVALFGASAFLGASMLGHPELADRLLFGRGAPTPESARQAIEDELAQLAADAAPEAPDPEDLVGALRRAKGRVTMEVGLADLAGELSTRACTQVLSALADATVDGATHFALGGAGAGLAVIAMGKLGGGEIGYGSDLDLFFVYDDPAEDAPDRFVRIAQRVMRLLSAPHGDGPGYELDTRLRPSGNQGLLVVSVEAFARYHRVGAAAPAQDEAGPPPEAEDWERQALLKARTCAGDRAVGARVIALAHQAAYERGAPPAERIHHLRMRMERELAGERRRAGANAAGVRPGPALREGGEANRYDLKLGRGGLVDIEFAVQWLQMKYGGDPRVRTTDTESALGALEACGYLDAALAAQLREGYRLLRRMEQRLRVLHGTSAQLIEEGAPGMALLARRMGMRDGPRGTASEALVGRYQEVTRDVRVAYLAVLGLDPSS